MISIQLLGQGDTILPTDWCRPLDYLYTEFGELHLTNAYSGKPINHLRWLRVSDVLGDCWFGKTVGQYHSFPGAGFLEFVRGHIPPSHQFDTCRGT